MAFPTNWLKKHKITIDHTKVSGSANLTNFPVLLTEANFLSSAFDNSQGKEIYTNHLLNDSSLNAYWRFEGNSNDSKGSANGTDTNVSYGTSYGKFGKGVSIGSSNSYISCSTSPNLTGDFSISVWVKRNATGSSNTICEKKKAGATRQWLHLLFMESNAIRFGFYGDDLDTTLTFPDTTSWHLVTVTYNNTSKARAIYYDGVLVASGTAGGSPDFGTGAFNIGVYNNANNFNGYLDDMAVFTKALSATEIMGLYTGGQDLRFSSDSAGSTQLAHEVVNWDIVNDKAEVYVKIPTLSYTADTTIYVWYDNDSATPQARDLANYGSNAVWSAFRLVAHDLVNDSTANGYKGTVYTGATETTGITGKGIDFSGSGYVDYGSQIPCLGNGDFTVETWINSDTLRDWSDIFNQQSSSPISTGGTYGIEYMETGKVFSWCYGLSTNSQSATSPITVDGGWFHIVATFNHTSKVATVYVNGSQVVQETFSDTWSFTPTHTSFSSIYIGNATYQKFGTHDGQQDEIRLVNNVLSNGWFQTEYNNTSSPSTFAKWEVDTNSDKSAKITGCLQTNDTRDTKIHGQSSINDTRSSKIHGVSTTQDNRNVKIKGQLSTSDTRATKIHGVDTVSDNRSAKLTGGTLTNSERSSHIKGGRHYSRESSSTLKTNDDTLSTNFNEQDYTNVGTDNDVYVDLTGTNKYFQFLFKEPNKNNTDGFKITWKGKSTVAPSSHTVYLQIYNRTTASWTTLTSNNSASANTEFTLESTVNTNISDYYDANYIISCRTYQEAS